MAIAKGSTNIVAISRGTTSYSAVYKGNVKLFDRSLLVPSALVLRADPSTINEDQTTPLEGKVCSYSQADTWSNCVF